jgi:hypothetical protein|tara:strand:- start:286 stop:399 length:114 start_codon:yes stop_codon:yes gene_type:complete
MIQSTKEWLMEKWDNTSMKTKIIGAVVIVIIIIGIST